MHEIWEYGVDRLSEDVDLSLLAREEKGELSSGRSRRLVPDPGLSSPVSRTGVTSSSPAPASALLPLAALFLAPCLLAASLEPAFWSLVSPLSTLSVLPRRARLTACQTFHYKIYYDH